MKKLLLLMIAAMTAVTAAPIVYTVSVDTSTVSGTVGSFEMNWGGLPGSVAMTATVSDFSTNGTLGSEIVDANNTGDLPGSVVFSFVAPTTATTSHNFTFGSTFQFNLTVDPALSGSDPNSFALLLFDGQGSELLVGSGFGPLVTIDLFDGLPNVFIGGDPTAPVTVTEASPIPEPSTYALIAGGLGVVALIRRKR